MAKHRRKRVKAFGIEPIPIRSLDAKPGDFSVETRLDGPTGSSGINPGRKRPMTSAERYWYEKTMSLDWSSMDKADPYWLNRINWFSTTGGTRPYPGRPGERPGMYAEDED
jgi:hypothetical protein